MYVHVNVCSWELEVKVTDDCEPPGLGSGSQTQASVRVICVFNHGVISLAPIQFLLSSMYVCTYHCSFSFFETS